ncbi:MAG: NYN domain-containing protein [Lewinellaceae bacterium]|nr:NYN domain-containing protein [Phaeodactylibacter sp.]MCB9039786.1 NYN domain-containing protein [Lewinellaceae bacterium]
MSKTSSTQKERVIVYIDGFNLYFGMTHKWKDIKWLDVYALSNSLLKPGQVLCDVKYFTSRVSNDHGKQKRQTTYLEAIEVQGAKLIYGQYQANTEECYRCGNIRQSPKEKMTDVNIATHLLVDAIHDRYDTAILVSGDSDLVPPIKAVHQNFTEKGVVVAFPPNRQNINVQKAAKASFIIGRKKLKDNQLPSKVSKPNGYILEKPSEWF